MLTDDTFRRYMFAPTHYTLRSGSFYDVQTTDWVLEASDADTLEDADREAVSGGGTNAAFGFDDTSGGSSRGAGGAVGGSSDSRHDSRNQWTTLRVHTSADMNTLQQRKEQMMPAQAHPKRRSRNRDSNSNTSTVANAFLMGDTADLMCTWRIPSEEYVIYSHA